jgi:hypothetical protein
MSRCGRIVASSSMPVEVDARLDVVGEQRPVARERSESASRDHR